MLLPLSDSIRPDHRRDAGTPIEDAAFNRFNQMNDVFSRSWWDEAVKTKKTKNFFQSHRSPLEGWRRARGFQRKDYALRNASWHGADIFAEMRQSDGRREGFLDPLTSLRESSADPDPIEDPEAETIEFKHVARVLGADLVGVAERDDRWLYTERYSHTTKQGKPNEIDPSLDWVVVIGQAMDASMIATAPSALAGAATGLGYSKDVIGLLLIAQYIQNLGYTAVPTLNDTALAIPYAIRAGLGEYGRNGLVITPNHGSNVRFGKIFTDMPLATDEPIRFGVTEMCELCRACSNACPSDSIPEGRPTSDLHNESNISGIKKWTVNGETCFAYWAKINSDCSVCVRACPYTRDHTKLANRIWFRLASIRRLRRLALWLDVRSERGKRVSSKEWWASANPANADSSDESGGVPVHLLGKADK